MRLSFLLMATAIALLGSSAMVFAISNDEAISHPNQVVSNGAEGRRLRVHKIPSDEHEERGFNVEKFNRLMNDQSYRTHRFNNWIKKQYTDRHVYNLLRVGDNPNYNRIFHDYQTYIENFAPRLVSK